MIPPDAAARAAVSERLDETIFLEAGAGSGKTTCLIDRFVALVESGIPADRIAAITFTEKAAGELVDKVRAELQKQSAASVRCRTALAALDRAAVCTLHAFAQRVLTEHPIEAGLPPRITVLDEIASQLAFEERWDAFIDRILDDEGLERTLRLLLAAGTTLDHLHKVAEKFGQNWDLVAERTGGPVTDVPPLDVDSLLAAVDSVVELGDGCTDADDKLVGRIHKIAEWACALRRAADEDARLELLRKTPSFAVGNLGQQRYWRDCAAVRARVTALKATCDALCEGVQQACLTRIAEELARFTVGAAEERRRAGELEFHDLLVLAREAMRDPRHGAAVRDALRQRYQRLLLDEFQDTDQIQVELAVLIASSDPDAASKPWSEVQPDPGRLFFVGDPKQSIYRFRRADIAMFLQARDSVGGRVEQLTTNFRTGEPVVHWVNHTFGRLIVEEPDSQPAYLALDPVRPAPPTGPPVAFVGNEANPVNWKADQLREAEAADVAAAIREMIGDSWSVCDQTTKEWRPARWGDIAILLPARTSLRALERALENAGVPYRAETSSLVYGTREIRDLLVVARAVEDPTDSLAVVAALRTPAFGCGDDDLYRWRTEHNGRWDHQGAFPEGTPPDHVVALGLEWLSALHRERLWLSPSQVLERIVRERRLMEIAFVHERPRDLWRRLRFVVDQCRAWEEAGGGTLRDYLRWVKLQSAEGSRVIETVLPETDDQAVRILTVHGAKGLEFPITILSGMTTQLSRKSGGVQVLFPSGRGWAVHIKKGLETEEFKESVPIEEQMDYHERLRLLYVAATRARDHLVVSVHRKDRASPRSSAAQLLYDAGWDPDLVAPLAWIAPPAAMPTSTAFDPTGEDLPSMAEWQEQHTAALAVATRPVATSATRLAEEAAARAAATAESPAGLQKDPRDIDLPPWQKGRYGSAIGRAVHAVLQTVDLTTGAGLAETAAAQAAAEGVLGREDVIEALCRSALASEVVRRAARLPHWREVYVGVPYEAGVVEGYIDLLYRDDDGLVVVDYKTDSWQNEADLAAKVDRYRVQLETYAMAAARAVDEPVTRTLLLFLAAAGTARGVALAAPR